jgi:hypothetical protein
VVRPAGPAGIEPLGGGAGDEIGDDGEPEPREGEAPAPRGVAVRVAEQVHEVGGEALPERAGVEMQEPPVPQLRAGAPGVVHAGPLSRLRARASATSSTSRAASAEATFRPNGVIR